MDVDKEILRAIFGPESTGATPLERALSSKRTFVRSQDHLAFLNSNATGRRLSAFEALDAFGFERLLEILQYGAAVLPAAPDEPAGTLRRRREHLGLSVAVLSKRTGLDKKDIDDAENPKTRSPIRALQRIASALGLDERVISAEPAPAEDPLGMRLRSLGGGSSGLSENTVATFAEAAWVIRTETRLRIALRLSQDAQRQFQPDNNYGSRDYPAWLHGYYLARKVRTTLNLSPIEPIRPLRQITLQLGIPLILAALPEHIAGATISTGSVRGIVVNATGQNENVWVRRATIAHELAHLLWDPESVLKTITVDDYTAINSGWQGNTDYVEARANAFAVEFLAPQSDVEKRFRRRPEYSVGLRDVMEHFGISFTAARFHISNATDKRFEVGDLDTPDKSPTDDWKGIESFSLEWFPLPETPELRRGPFAGFVVAAERAGIVSEETAAFYLGVSTDAYRGATGAILDLYDDVVSGVS